MKCQDSIRVDPGSTLRRKGLSVDDGYGWEDDRAWRDTLISTGSGAGVPHPVLELLEERGAYLFSLLKHFLGRDGLVRRDPVDLSALAPPLDSVRDRLKELGIIRETPDGYRHCNKGATAGATFEAFVLHTLQRLEFGASREALVKYPKEWGGKSYDPDGQRYDILAGIDITTVMWIECKKPLYFKDSHNPLSGVLSQANLAKFYRRAWRLRPEIAVFLVDTREDYWSKLERCLVPSYSCVERRPEELEQIVARLNGFIYLARIDYRSHQKYYSRIKRTIMQILYAARTRPAVVEAEVGPLIR